MDFICFLPPAAIPRVFPHDLPSSQAVINATDADCPALEWTFAKPPNDPKAHVSWKKLSAPQLFRDCIEKGFNRATDIAREMGITPGRVSHLAGKAIKEGWLKKSGRMYSIKPHNPQDDKWTKSPAEPEMAKTE